MTDLSKNEIRAALLAAELGGDEYPSLDAHGLTVKEAEEEVTDFLCREHAGLKRKQIKTVRIITGHGNGRLFSALLSNLTSKKLNFILACKGSEKISESGAVVLVVLAPNA